MPLIRLNHKVIYFAHVPKTAGSSLLEFFDAIGGTVVLSAVDLKVAYPAARQARRRQWEVTSPQHLPAAATNGLINPEFYDAAFMFTRHPEDRLLSEYRWRKKYGKSWVRRLGFSSWFQFFQGVYSQRSSVLDGHLLPQSAYVQPQMQVFALEDGFQAFAQWLSEVAEMDPIDPQLVPRVNTADPTTIPLPPEDQQQINAFYAQDFERFGYQPRGAVANPKQPRTSNGLWHITGRVYGRLKRNALNIY